MSAVIEPARPRIRTMELEDLAGVAAIERQAYPYPWSQGIFRDCLRVGYSCWVLEHEGDLAGYGIMSMGVHEAHVLNVCIQPTLQGCGLGRRLLQHLLDRAGMMGAAAVYLEVRRSNVAAQRLYRTLGFMEVGVRRGYYRAAAGREDAVVFMLDLTDE